MVERKPLIPPRKIMARSRAAFYALHVPALSLCPPVGLHWQPRVWVKRMGRGNLETYFGFLDAAVLAVFGRFHQGNFEIWFAHFFVGFGFDHAIACSRVSSFTVFTGRKPW